MMIYTVNLSLIIILGNLLCLNKKYGKKVFIIIACIQLILLCGLRALTVGHDTDGYINLYYYNVIHTPLGLNFFKTFNREMGYYLMTKIISLISGNYTLLLTVVCAIPMILICRTVYKYSKDMVLSIALFVGLRPYAFIFTGIRQSIAVGICFYSYKFIKEKRIIPFIICILIASTFHMSALAFLLAYFISQISYRNIIIISLSFPLLLIFRDGILSLCNFILMPLGYQFTGDSSYKDGLSTIIIYALILMCALLFRTKMMKRDKTSTSVLIAVVLFSIFFYSLGYVVSPFTRIALYFGWFIILLLPEIIEVFDKVRDKYVIKIVIYALLILQYLYFGPGSSIVPYRFFWQ